jgi:hypothetical protein
MIAGFQLIVNVINSQEINEAVRKAILIKLITQDNKKPHQVRVSNSTIARKT